MWEGTRFAVMQIPEKASASSAKADVVSSWRCFFAPYPNETEGTSETSRVWLTGITPLCDVRGVSARVCRFAYLNVHAVTEHQKPLWMTSWGYIYEFVDDLLENRQLYLWNLYGNKHKQWRMRQAGRGWEGSLTAIWSWMGSGPEPCIPPKPPNLNTCNTAPAVKDRNCRGNLSGIKQSCHANVEN